MSLSSARNVLKPETILKNAKILVSDFDETITNKDTISLVFQAAYDYKPDFPKSQQYFVDVYMKNYNQFINSNKIKRDSIENEIFFQKQLKKIELSSIKEYERLELFKDVPKKNFSQKASLVESKKGFIDFINLESSNKKFIILSVNWTRIIIEQFLQKLFLNPNDFIIIANEFEFDNEICLGSSSLSLCNDDSFFNPENFSLKDGIRTGYDKLLIIQKIINYYQLNVNNGEIVYIGDSSTDVLPMIECQRGIIMKGGSASKLLNDLGFSDNNNFLEVKDWTDLIK
ncbi:hypothetical protein PACTADRAFT_48415 [Pachysolen tannophilus NRRL Y-2460]|uniref:Uncharacterized protein n=1 Tax=Pachysolen tannophilus NRRL Y-2460 TaxID=669874 RepID=A0A1E4TXY8_PACTA|nr:hypothetical protein PACTADRAFT_48415 [Pachysolen tannophilus NRRL Y-2460]